MLLPATSLAPSILEQPSLLFLRDSGTSLLPCFFTCGASSFPTRPATAATPSTSEENKMCYTSYRTEDINISAYDKSNYTTVLPRNWLTFTAPPVACLAAFRPLVTLGLTSAGVSSGVMFSRSLVAPLWMALPVASAPRTSPRPSQEDPVEKKNHNTFITCFLFKVY